MRQQESDQTIDQIMELLSELQKASTFSKVEETSKKLTIAISELTHQAEIAGLFSSHRSSPVY
ncbi:MAG TPA: hypothetical protein V6C97_26515 [Oculatellaceae cyanobacterium]